MTLNGDELCDARGSMSDGLPDKDSVVPNTVVGYVCVWGGA